MARNKTLSDAKKAKQDEFYTQYGDIQTEMNAYLEYDPNVFRGKTVLLPCDDPEWSNFTRYFAENFAALGLKKLVSTSYAPASKTAKYGSLFEYAAAQNGERPQNERGKIFVLDRDVTGDGKINFEDLEWHYLEGDGDFRSEEVCRLRDEADIIVTNPPFSLFREFLAWILEGRGGLTCGGSGSPALPCGETSVGRGVLDAPSQGRGGSGSPALPRDCGEPSVGRGVLDAPPKQFLIIGNMNAIAYKEVFPLIKKNEMWLGESIHSGDREFGVPKDYPLNAAGWRVDAKGNHYIRVKGVRWFTNFDHGRRHQPLQLMTMADNIKYSRHKEVKGVGYAKYDNYDAIEVPFTDAIPSDYDGVMGVPISFLDKHCPEQFEILGLDRYVEDNPRYGHRFTIDGQETYARILIRARREKW